MVKIGDLNTNKAAALEKIVLKNWKDCCDFFYDGCKNTCDVLIADNVPIIIKHFAGGDTQVTFFACGDDVISVENVDYDYITIT